MNRNRKLALASLLFFFVFWVGGPPQCNNRDRSLAQLLSSVLGSGGVALAQSAPFCDKSYIFFLLDVSGSMKWKCTTDPTVNKHQDVRNAIKSIVSNTKFNSKVWFGLATFGAQYQLRIPISSTAWSSIYNKVDSYPSDEMYTRMGLAIRNAGAYLWGLKKNEPPKTKNRPYYLVLITDGYPTAPPGITKLDPAVEAAKLYNQYGIKTFVIGICFNHQVLNAVALAGGTKTPYDARNTSLINSAFTSILNTATKEVCDGLDNDCDGKVDEDWPLKGKSCSAGIGACRQTGTYVCKKDKTGVECSAKQRPAFKEVCDNKDNDCDGLVDENLTRQCKTPCGTGKETCRFGRWVNCTAPKPKAELCDGKDNDCDGKIDEDFSKKGRSCSVGKGECRRKGFWRCSADGRKLECSAVPGSPSTELCDGKDNDCDGKVDEDWPTKGQPCSSGTGACSSRGKFVCKPDGSGIQCSAPGGTPQPEVCDGKDNDCNGKIDDNLVRTCKTACGSGVETCKNGKWINCTARKPLKETCNGLDDDCNGKIDDGITRKCKTPCGEGREVCIRAQWTFCNAPKPQPEVCDGKDNDCNGKIDDLPPKPCTGRCGKGEAKCENGQWTGCSGPQPQPEVCDGKDNDCDGRIDNGLTRQCKTPCGAGTELCTNGKWHSCNAPLPQPEICDGRDNDCDGQTDENAKCPAGTVCKEGQCLSPCKNGECRYGLKCVKGLCIGDVCANVKCKTGTVCLGGRCVDLCKMITCQKGLICSRGQCVRKDCYFTGCPKGQRCVNGHCQKDPCHGMSCPSGQFCREGKCYPSCARVKCKDDEICVDGRCVANPEKSGPCAKVQCPSNQVCVNGQCRGNPCAAVPCAKGRICKNGQCVHDPCHNIKCPAGQVCRDGQCTAPKPGDNDTSDDSNPDNPDNPDNSGPDAGPSTSSPDVDSVDNSSSASNFDGEGGRPVRGKGCVCSGGDFNFSVIFYLLLLGFLFLRRRR